MMNNELKQLMELQAIDSVIDGYRVDLAAFPAQIDALRAQIKEIQDSIEQEKKNLTQLQVKKKEKEIEVSTQEQKMKKNEMDLNTVKSNEAYKGLLTEIEAAKNFKAQLEDEILTIMMDNDRLLAELKSAEVRVKGEQQKIEAQIKAKEGEIAQIQSRLEAEEKKRQEFAPNIKPDILTRYEFIRGKKKDIAIVQIEKDTCGGCNTILTQVLINEARKGKEITVCESCSRILYIPELLNAEPAPAAPPAQ
jgi:predicted  nucleic acid-binding Zn-ribbon protein